MMKYDNQLQSILISIDLPKLKATKSHDGSLPMSIRSGASRVYFIKRAIGSASKLGIISMQCSGSTSAVLISITSNKDENDSPTGHFTKNRRCSDNKLSKGTGNSFKIIN